MRTSPSIAPDGPEQDTYIVLDDFGSLGRAWRETDEAGANRATLVRNLLDDNMKIRSASSPSIPPRAGPVTSLWTSPMSYAADLLNTTRCQRRFSPSRKRRPTNTEPYRPEAIRRLVELGLRAKRC